MREVKRSEQVEEQNNCVLINKITCLACEVI